MDHGLYTAYLGMRARQRALDVLANNIANASTPGFKADRTLYRSIEAVERDAFASNGQSGRSPQLQLASFGNQFTDNSLMIAHGRNVGLVTGTTADFSMGMLRQTDRPLDIALDGDGFLVVQTPQGERYTRAGALKLNTSGQLVTQQGDLVAGEDGPITLPQGDAIIGEHGEISVGGETVGRLKLVRFDDPRTALLKQGDSLFVAIDPRGQRPTPAASTRVLQGTLEMSNVDAISETAAMIQNSREFDSLQRSITMLMNDLGRKVASEIGRI